VNLEPCSHFGRTPPCADRIIQAGVARVVAAMRDPNPLVAGTGFEKLKAAAIAVSEGIYQSEAERLNEAYCKFIQTRKPFVTLKTAMTLDGKIAEATGHSRWITGQAARERVQQLRFDSDALLTGIGTILADDPLLTDRTGQIRRRSLLRGVMDTRLRLPLESRFARSRDEGDIILFCSEARDAGRQRQIEQAGLQVVPLPTPQGKISLDDVLAELARRDVVSVLIEAGPRLNFDALRSGCVDKLQCFVAPKILGGQTALPVAGGEGFLRLDHAVLLVFESTEQIGPDLLIQAYLRESKTFQNKL
jgi:diaminohydroxyphosphoribosylaminopyrimidine deaminase/5-amino-6-(5-phosphoribosylamino)uracil reductase